MSGFFMDWDGNIKPSPMLKKPESKRKWFPALIPGEARATGFSSEFAKGSIMLIWHPCHPLQHFAP